MLALLGAVWLGLSNGSAGFDAHALASLWGDDSNQTLQIIILDLRLPRVVNAFIVGGLLALAGALIQVLIRNPLGDPYVLGISGGAAFGALLALSLRWPGWWVETGAIAGAVLSAFLLVVLSRGHLADRSSRLLLSGIVMAAGWGGVITLLLALTRQQQLQGMMFWLMGDLQFTSISWGAAAILLLLLFILWFLAPALDLFAQGETLAGSVGVDVVRLHWILFACSSLLTATAVSMAGTIGFVGLIVPHLIRLSGHAGHRQLLPASVFLGGILLLLADSASRTLFAPIQVPVGVMLALVGVPVFLYLLNRSKV